MMKKYAVLSDIHGNIHALKAVIDSLSFDELSGVIILGDIIDYGMRSNESTKLLREWLLKKNSEMLNKDFVVCNIWGNHEKEILNGTFTGYSSKRGEECAKYTAKILNEETREYLRSELDESGKSEFVLEAYKCIAIHGSLDDPYWKSVEPGDLKGDYSAYDIVFSGHSHKSHVFRHEYPSDDVNYRNKHTVLFINPGSVGQPRNHNPNAQYAILDIDTMSVELRCIPYDVRGAMETYDGSVDDFYRERLERGV